MSAVIGQLLNKRLGFLGVDEQSHFFPEQRVRGQSRIAVDQEEHYLAVTPNKRLAAVAQVTLKGAEVAKRA